MWACDLSSGFKAIYYSANYDKFGFGLVFKVRQTKAHISYPIIASPFDTEEC